MINFLRDDLVILIPLRESDFEKLFAIASDPLIWEQHPERDRYKREVFQKYFDSAIASGSAFIITDAVTGEYIGCTRYYDYNEETSSIAIGFTFLVRACWGGKYNRSCKKLMLDYAFRYVNNVYFHIGANNIRSRKATEKFGAKVVGEQPRGDDFVVEYLLERRDYLKNI